VLIFGMLKWIGFRLLCALPVIPIFIGLHYVQNVFTPGFEGEPIALGYWVGGSLIAVSLIGKAILWINESR
jgi:hypothetical protein